MGATTSMKRNTPQGNDVVATKHSNFSVFEPSAAKGGCIVNPSKAALVCIEFQNEVRRA